MGRVATAPAAAVPSWADELAKMTWTEQAGERGRLAAIRAGALVRAAVEVVLPPQALDGARKAGPVLTRGLSAEAWSRISFIEAPVCDRCGAFPPSFP